MRRLALLVVILGALWFAFKDPIYRGYLRLGASVQPAELTYTELSDWAVKPAELPAGAWEKPWGIDAFIIVPPANVAARHGLLPPADEAVVTASLDSLKDLLEATPGELPAYAPFYRAPAPSNSLIERLDVIEFAQQDIAAAFEHYLTTSSRGRGFIILAAEDAKPFLAPLLERIQQEDTVNRFGGLVMFGASDNSALYGQLKCADALSGACHQDVPTKTSHDMSRLVLPTAADGPTGTAVVDAAGVANAIKLQAETVSVWLDETQPKPVEPFFATQVISAAPVYAIGETPIAEETEGTEDPAEN